MSTFATPCDGEHEQVFAVSIACTVRARRGAYLYEKMVESRFVRSGKAVLIVKRVREHATAAEHRKLTDSRFYLSYPTREAVQRNPQLGDPRVRKGGSRACEPSSRSRISMNTDLKWWRCSRGQTACARG